MLNSLRGAAAAAARVGRQWLQSELGGKQSLYTGHTVGGKGPSAQKPQFPWWAVELPLPYEQSNWGRTSGHHPMLSGAAKGVQVTVGSRSQAQE